jgi:hypothetical protein
MTSKELDAIYDHFDQLMTEHRLEELDSIIKNLSPTDLSIDHLLGVLTASLPVKSSLPSRPAFCKAVEKELISRGVFEPGLLTGLE